MSSSQIVGMAILAVVFGGFFALMVQIEGWLTTAAIWLAALAFTAIVVLAIGLAVGDVTITGFGR